MKKILLLILSVLMCVCSLFSCDNQAEETSSALEGSENTESEISEVSEESVMYPEYWGNSEYARVENIGAFEEIEAHEMTFTRVKASKYTVTYVTEAGKMTVTFDEKPWGTYNLGGISIVDNDGVSRIFASGATDLEYVYRTQKNEDSKFVWSGGNHGNEILLSLKFYNGENGEEIVLANDGDSIVINKLHIIEKTNLMFRDDTDGDGYGYRYKDKETYTEDDIYAEATRKYTIVGPMIKLNVDYNYLKDTYHQLSYTCMFPISKQYGNYCDMYDQSGNKIKSIVTPADTTAGTFYRPNAATRAIIYGSVDKRFKFDVFVNTVDDSLDGLKNFYKTMYWDMNLGSNKIYFSKYEDGVPTKIDAGTQFNTECIWAFVYDKDAK